MVLKDYLIKCKMCGGDLHPVENNTICECEFCGTLQTIPAIDNEKKALLFNRAQRLLFNCEFDKAASVFESIVAEFPSEAEAYWGLVLCKYGIEYVDDPATGKKVPTCHRSSYDSVLENQNYEQALENTDAIAGRVYREEARTIESLREKIIELSNSAETYDIFISYKEIDEKGTRTEDSVLAQDIYNALTEKGYKVFFSRISLEDKLGQEYEPYIFAALNSARVMLVIGTDYEYMNAVWVKNEWSRFLKLISKGEKKTIIPCYKNMDPHDMPKELLKLQAQDMGKIGAMQDLTRGVDKLFAVPQKSISKEEERKRRIENIRILARRANDAVDIENGYKYYQQLILEEPNDWEALFYSALYHYLIHINEDCSFVFSNQLKQTFELISQQIKDEQTEKAVLEEVSNKTLLVIAFRMQAVLNEIRSIKARTPAYNQQDAMDAITGPYNEEILRIHLACAEGLLNCKQYSSAMIHLDQSQSTINNIKPVLISQNIRDFSHRVDELIARMKEEEEKKRHEEEQVRQQRIAQYWASHSEEKKELESEIDRLREQISQRRESIEALSRKYDVSSIESLIDKLKSQKEALSIFKMKEKKAIQSQIEEYNRSFNSIQSNMNAEKRAIEKQIEPLENRIREIHEMLTQDRQ